MTLAEMKFEIERTQDMAKRGMLTAGQAEQWINFLINDTLPEEAVTDEESWRRMEQRRLAKRFEWRFLLSLSKERMEKAK